MRHIGTHNSATGEPSKGLLSLLVSPFAKCQSKSIVEQYYDGARYFDIRVRKKGNRYYCCHGIWRCKTSVENIILNLSFLAKRYNERVYVMFTYEGKCENEVEFEMAVKSMLQGSHLTLNEVNVKKPIWKCIYKRSKSYPYIQGYKVLDGRSWHTLIPIPYLWRKIYASNEKFYNDCFTFIDFL